MSEKLITGLFYKNGFELKNGPKWGMSLKAAGSMRFRWNEYNENRVQFLDELKGTNYSIAQIELIHSKKVFDIDNIDNHTEYIGDGLITRNKKIIPTVTVADCMPIYLYEPTSGVFGMLHSGWKGTGIVKEAIIKACEIYGAKREEFCVVMGPHIHECCYKVDEERADYFRKNFSDDCVTADNRLSLAKANLAVLRELGIQENNIVICNDCTSCNEKFGSFRRETSLLPENTPLEIKQKKFTVQAAWVKW